MDKQLQVILFVQRKDMLQLILSSREDENEFVQIPHNYNRNITKGFYDREIVANISHFFMSVKLNVGLNMHYSVFVIKYSH